MTGELRRKIQLISTHTLRKEGDIDDAVWKDTDKSFQPTPSARRVTSELF